MRVDILENTRQRLRLTLRSSLPLYAFFGVLFIVMGGVCFRLLAVETRIVVTQQQFSYTQTCVWVFDCGTLQAPVQDVRRVATVDYEIQVELPDGAHRLGLAQSDGDEKVAIARELEAAVSRPGASYRHEEGSTLAGLLLGLVCLGGGLAILAAIQRVSLVADRDAGTLGVTRRLLLWPFGQSFRMPLSELHAVRVVPHTFSNGRHHVTSYSVRLEKRGQGRADSVGVTFLPMFTEPAATELAGTIRNWLG